MVAVEPTARRWAQENHRVSEAKQSHGGTQKAWLQLTWPLGVDSEFLGVDSEFCSSPLRASVSRSCMMIAPIEEMLGEDWEVEHLAQELAHSRLSINGSSDEDECTFPTDIYLGAI